LIYRVSVKKYTRYHVSKSESERSYDEFSRANYGASESV
jgi:hypothetical protein